MLVTKQELSHDTVAIARSLIGANLCRRIAPGKIIRLPITEAEAYDGFDDKACHAAKGKTPRTTIMFEPAGKWYVYLCYGVHWMLNIVTGPKDYPAAVLLRGAGDIVGPGRLTKALAITGELNGKTCAKASGLWLEWPAQPFTGEIQATPRIGINYAGEQWINAPYRFVSTPKKR